MSDAQHRRKLNKHYRESDDLQFATSNFCSTILHSHGYSRQNQTAHENEYPPQHWRRASGTHVLTKH